MVHFELKAWWTGKLVRGAREGIYQARIVIADDDYTHKAQAAKVIPKKYFSFETSGLTVQLPSTDIHSSSANEDQNHVEVALHRRFRLLRSAEYFANRLGKQNLVTTLESSWSSLKRRFVRCSSRTATSVTLNIIRRPGGYALMTIAPSPSWAKWWCGRCPWSRRQEFADTACDASDDAKIMPPDHRLSEQQIADLKKWIDDGAAWPALVVPDGIDQSLDKRVVHEELKKKPLGVATAQARRSARTRFLAFTCRLASYRCR